MNSKYSQDFFAEVGPLDLTFKQMRNVHQVEIYSTAGDHYSSGLIYQLQNENDIIAKYGTLPTAD